MTKIKKICKVEGCNGLYSSKGYCEVHYYRVVVKKGPEYYHCKYCGTLLEKNHYKWCNPSCAWAYRYYNDEEYRNKQKEYAKKSHITIPAFQRGQKRTVYLGIHCDKELLKSLDYVKKEKKRILEDCIRNPAKYLKEDV